MGSYDDAVAFARQRVTSELCVKEVDKMQLAGAIDDLNKAWDELTNCLVRQRTERDVQIRRLIDELAEAKKGQRST